LNFPWAINRNLIKTSKAPQGDLRRIYDPNIRTGPGEGSSASEHGKSVKALPEPTIIISFEEKEKEFIITMVSEPAIPPYPLGGTPKDIGKRARAWPETVIPPELGKEMGTKASASWANFLRKLLPNFPSLNFGRRLLPFGHE
jgi:hypothetical protein